MFKILQKLEDSNRPFLGPNVKILNFFGLILPKNIYLKSLCITLYILLIIFNITEYIDVWLIKNNLNMLLNNMKLTFSVTVHMMKVTSFLYYQQNWRRIINYVTKADLAQRKTDDLKKLELISKFTKCTRKITYSYGALVFTSSILVTCYPISKYLFSSTYRQKVKNGTEPYFEALNSWVPFDKSTFEGYLVAYIYQCFSAIISGSWITAYDTTILAIMVFFKAEFELLRIDCVDIFGTEKEKVSDEIALERLQECHRRHMELIKYTGLFDDCLSLVMFLYALICSIVLCLTAYQLTHEPSLIQKILVMELLIFFVVELFIYCLHSNNVLYASTQMSKAPYESNWWTRNVAQRKNVYILTSQFSKVVRFSVGAFATLNVATFIQIVKGAYSYYTLLAQSQMK